MSIYFRVHVNKRDSDPSLGQLYDSKLNPVEPSVLNEDDILFKASPGEFGKIKMHNPRAVFFRVHEDKSNRDLRAGELYDENFSGVSADSLKGKGNIVVIPVTPDELAMTLRNSN